MRQTDRYEFEVDARLIKEAMVIGGQTLMRGQGKLAMTAFGILLTVLAAMGGAAIATLIAQHMGADPTWWVLVGWLAAGGLWLFHQNILFTIMAQQAARAPIHQGRQVMQFDKDGVLYESGSLRWRTPWRMIDTVADTKNTICLISGGIALYVPKSEVGDKADTKQLVADLKAQIANA